MPSAMMPPPALSTRAPIFGSTLEMTLITHSTNTSTTKPKMISGMAI